MKSVRVKTDLESAFSAYPENDGNFRRLCEDFDSSAGIVPFIGAGLSIPFGFPSWQGFLRSQSVHAGIEPLIAEMINAFQYEEAADKLLETLRNQAFNDALDDAFGDHRLEGKEILGAVSLIPRLAVGPVITTNFDHVLERAFDNAERPFEQIAWGAKVDLAAKAFTHRRRLLLKIHGDVDDRGDRVLTLREYRRNYERPGHVRRLIKQIFSTRPVLFIGCSLSTDRIINVLAQIARISSLTSHYAFLEAPENADLLRQKTRFLSDHRIRPIWYPHNQHQFIETLIASLIEQKSSTTEAFPLLSTGLKSSAPVKQALILDATADKAVSKSNRLSGEREAIVHNFHIAGLAGEIIVSFEKNRQAVELILQVDKEGPTLTGLYTCFGQAVSIGLQHCIPIQVYIEEFAHTRFEPSGWTGNPNIGFARSIVDYVFRWIQLLYPEPAPASEEIQLPVPTRRQLPNECASVSHSFSIAGHEAILSVLLFEDGVPGAIHVQLPKEGATVQGMMTAWLTAVSIGLQYGIPLSTFCDKMAHMRFEPSGWTNNAEIGFAKSFSDYIFRWLRLRFLPGPLSFFAGSTQQDLKEKAEADPKST